MNKHVDEPNEPEWEPVCETEETDDGDFCATRLKIQLADKSGQWIRSDYHVSLRSVE